MGFSFDCVFNLTPYSSIMSRKLSRSELIESLALHGLIHNNSPFLIGGNAKSAGYVRRMEAERKIIFDKISRPSKYMIEKYGHSKVAVTEPEPVPVVEYDDAPSHNDDVVDYNVGRPKPKRVSAKNRGPTEAEEERQERAKRAEVERRHAVIEEHEQLKASLVECRKMLENENNAYASALDELKHRKGMRKVAKEDMEQKIISKHHDNVKKIKAKFPKVFQYVKTHKLNANDLNAVHKHIRAQIAKL